MEQQAFISHGSGGWRPEIKAPADPVPGRAGFWLTVGAYMLSKEIECAPGSWASPRDCTPRAQAPRALAHVKSQVHSSLGTTLKPHRPTKPSHPCEWPAAGTGPWAAVSAGSGNVSGGPSPSACFHINVRDISRAQAISVFDRGSQSMTAMNVATSFF